MDWRIILLVVYGVINLFGVLFAVGVMIVNGPCPYDTPEPDCMLPYNLYYNSNMNWFGAWLCSILLLLVLPVAYLIQFIWWLCHIGERDEDDD